MSQSNNTTSGLLTPVHEPKQFRRPSLSSLFGKKTDDGHDGQVRDGSDSKETSRPTSSSGPLTSYFGTSLHGRNSSYSGDDGSQAHRATTPTLMVPGLFSRRKKVPPINTNTDNGSWEYTSVEYKASSPSIAVEDSPVDDNPDPLYARADSVRNRSRAASRVASRRGSEQREEGAPEWSDFHQSQARGREEEREELGSGSRPGRLTYPEDH